MVHSGHIAGILGHLGCVPVYDTARCGTYMLDPLCGDGSAAEQLGAVLGCHGVFGVEPVESLGRIAKRVLQGGTVLSPCSPIHVMCTPKSFGMAFVNPLPKTARDGDTFGPLSMLNRVTPLLCDHGVLVMVCPFHHLAGNSELATTLDMLYHDVNLYRMPAMHGSPAVMEATVFGYKRPEPVERDLARKLGCISMIGIPPFCNSSMLPPLGGEQPASWRFGNQVGKEGLLRTWLVPGTRKPSTFKKIGYSLQEKAEMLASSPLNKHMEAAPVKRTYKPPLTPGSGHIGTILAAGILDGRVEGPDGVAHVVRGSSYKARYQDHSATRSSVALETGIKTVKERFSETPVTVIRCAMTHPIPCIKTFSNQPPDDDEG